MANGMNEGEKVFHSFFREVHDAYQQGRLDEARAGVELMFDELHNGDGCYSFVFYANAAAVTCLLDQAIRRAEHASTKEVA